MRVWGNIRLITLVLLVACLALGSMEDSHAAFLRGGTVSPAGGSSSSSSSGGASYLPTVGSEPLAVYSGYKVVSDYTGPLFQLTRVADSATLDVMPTITGAPDIDQITTFLSGATYAAVTKEYDQTGHGHHTASGTKLWCYNAINGVYSITHDSYLPAGNQRFALPSSLTGTLNSVTRVSVQSYATTNSAGIGILGPTYGGSTTLGIRAASTYQNKMGVNAGGTFKGATASRSRSQPQVTIVSSGASNLVTYQDGVSDTFTAASSNSWTGGYIGYVDATSNLAGEFYLDAIYPTGLSSGDEATLRAYLNTRFGVLTSSDTQIVWSGNSIVQGTSATLNHNNQWYMQQALDHPVFISNQGVAGAQAATIVGNVAFYTAEFNGSLAHNIMIAPEATNDIDAQSSGAIVGFGTSIFNSAIVPFVQAANTAGFEVIVPTMLPRNWVGDSTLKGLKTTEQEAYNTLVRNNAATYGYTVVDYAGIPQASNPSNTTYYADGIHPTSTLYQLMGNLLAGVINTKIAANDNPSPNLFAANDNWPAVWEKNIARW